jgi:uncharacterized membrane protein YqhA
MFDKLLNLRYVVIIAVFFLLINSLVFIVVGVVHCVQGYIEFLNAGFRATEGSRPGLHLMEGLDAFMLALVFLIFGLGVARLFVFDKHSVERIPAWLNVHDLKGLKVLLWETILVTLVILCVTNLIKLTSLSWETLIYPILILILAAALFLMRGKESH